LYRYIIQSGPHLTAKVLRYLKTLIGKAAIDRGFKYIPSAYFALRILISCTI